MLIKLYFNSLFFVVNCHTTHLNIITELNFPKGGSLHNYCDQCSKGKKSWKRLMVQTEHSRMVPNYMHSIFLSYQLSFFKIFFLVTLVSGQPHSQLSLRRRSSAPTEGMLNPLWPELELVMADTSASFFNLV